MLRIRTGLHIIAECVRTPPPKPILWAIYESVQPDISSEPILLLKDSDIVAAACESLGVRTLHQTHLPLSFPHVVSQSFRNAACPLRQVAFIVVAGDFSAQHLSDREDVGSAEADSFFDQLPLLEIAHSSLQILLTLIYIGLNI